MKLASKKQDQFRLKSDSFEVLVIKGGQKKRMDRGRQRERREQEKRRERIRGKGSKEAEERKEEGRGRQDLEKDNFRSWW